LVQKRFIHQLIFGILLIMCSGKLVHAQTAPLKDTIYTVETSNGAIIKFSAKDSIYNDLRNKKIHLYGDAKLDYDGTKLTSSYMLIDLKKNEVFATYTYDKDSVRVGEPKFSDGGEEIDAASIRYNFDTKKGYIQEVRLKQDENYLYMEVAKRQNNGEVHFRQGRFTTCDLEEPHYHFQLTKAILIPEKRIVSGPMNLWIRGVPTPFGLPFVFIPQKKPEERTHGILFPKFVPVSNYGFGVQDFGYYFPINDSLHTTFYANLYSRGSWGLSNHTEYNIRYKFQGSFDLGFQQFRSGFPFNSNNNKTTVIWNHRQDPKANPLWNFSTNVNFISDNNSKNTLDPFSKNYFNNTLFSDINIGRLFPGKPIIMGVKMSVKQNSITNNFTLLSPKFNTNVTRFFPFKPLRKNPVGPTRWYEQIGMTYNLEAQNSATFSGDLVKQKKYAQIGEQFRNGISQNTTLQTTISLFDNTWKLTPSLNYANNINFQQIRRSYDEISNTVITDTLGMPGMSHSLAFNAQLTTALYTYYRFVGNKKPLLRHILTPSFGFSYIPKLNKTASYTRGTGAAQTSVNYSVFESSLYTEAYTRDAAIINFGFNNTFELKRKSDKDTITGFKKTRLIELLSFTGSYDLLKDSMNLSDINMNMTISPVEFFSFRATASFSPYDWNDSTGVTQKNYALATTGKLGRFVQTNFSTSFTIAPKASRAKIEENKEMIISNWNADYNYFLMHPEQYIDFEIPWKVTLSHNLSINANTNKAFSSTPGRDYELTQTITSSGDISITKRWKLVNELSFDIKTMRIVNTNFRMTRNMHCWNLSFFCTPIGSNKSFVFSLVSTSNLFKDAKLDLRKPPEFF
jgi:hypothetical protein